MKLTPIQKYVINNLPPTRVFLEDLDYDLGYSTLGEGIYEIHLNTEGDVFDDNDVRDIVYLHECGHIYYGHCADYDSVKKVYDELCKKYNKTLEMVDVFGDIPFNSINIAMDCEINSKLLTIGNINKMKSVEKTLIDRKDLNLGFHEDWKGYLEEMFQKMDESEFLKNFKDLLKRMASGEVQIGESPLKRNGSSSGNSSGKSVSVQEMNKEVESGSGGGDKPECNKNLGMAPSDKDSMEINDLLQQIEDNEKHVGGSQHIEVELPEVVPESTEVLTDFFKSLFHHERRIRLDSLKAYNRGTRGRGNILYTSRSRKILKDIDNLMIIIDVSGSMNVKTIVNAVSAIREISNELGVRTKIVHWDSDLVQEYDINQIPSPKNLKRGGGGITYDCFRKVKQDGFSKVVLYSDMYNTSSHSFKDETKDLWVASIIVDYDPEYMGDRYYTEVIQNSDRLLLLSNKKR